jgi:hypothetical protein
MQLTATAATFGVAVRFQQSEGRYFSTSAPRSASQLAATVAAGAQEPTNAVAASLLSVYPNPVRGGQATVVFAEAKTGQDYRLRVSNVIGREMRFVTLRPDLMRTGQSLDLSTLPAGIYFCTLLSNDKVITTKRVTVQN